MADKVVLLGMEQDCGARLVPVLAAAGLEPVALDWPEFSPRGFGRDRPKCVLVDVDNPSAQPMEEFSLGLRKAWGEYYPIVAVAASRRFRDVSALLDAGASDCLAKTAPAKLMEKKILRAAAGAVKPVADELTDEVPTPLLSLLIGNDRCIHLGDIAGVYAGVTPRRPGYRRMAPPDDKWRGVITSDAVDRFFVGRPAGYLLWSRFHLFRMPPPEEYSVAEKVFLSRSGPPLRAAVDRSRTPAGTDVYSIVPKENVGAGFIACLLNSRLLDFYFNRFGGASDGRIRAEALRNTPVPRPTAEAVAEMARYAALLAHFGPNPEGWIDRQSRDEIREQMDNAVFRLYGAGAEAMAGLAALHF